MVWFRYSGDVGIVWFCSSGEVKMVWFWGSSGDAGSVWFYPRETSNPPYASRVNTTSPEAYHTSPEEENPSGEVKYLELVLVGKPPKQVIANNKIYFFPVIFLLIKSFFEISLKLCRFPGDLD